MENLLKTEIVSALGWTLVHSIWQSIILSILYFVLSKFVKSAQIKYQLGVGALFLQFVLAIFTFCNVVDFHNEVSSFNYINNMPQLLNSIKNQVVNLTFLESVQVFLNTNLTFIVQIWLVGVSVFCLRLLFDIYFVNQLKIKGLQEVDKQTMTKFLQLKEQLNLPQTIKIFESNQTFCPIVVGNLKPFILLPIGLTASLTIKELEAILVHELAHIKRYDFLVNILQSVIEIMFFFNPAIWWISSQVREEREHCCDDFSVSITGDKMLLVSALAQVESFRVNHSLVMAFGKKKMTLLSRVKRILGIKQPENQRFESLITMVVVAVICGGLLIFKSDEVAAKANDISKKMEQLYTDNETSNSDEKLKSSTGNPEITKADTSTTKTETVTTDSYQQEVVTDDDKSTYKYLSTSSNKSSFWIDENGEIFVDGKKYNASADLLDKIKPFLRKMKVLGTEMDVYGSKMNDYSKEMEVFSERMEDKNAPMTELGRLMEEQGKLLDKNVKLQTKYSLKASLASVEDDKTTQESNLKLEKEYERKVKEISNEMERLGKEMKILGDSMSDDGKPMTAIGKKMEIEGEKMNVLGKKMEAVSKDLIEVLPADLKVKIKNIEKEFHH